MAKEKVKELTRLDAARAVFELCFAQSETELGEDPTVDFATHPEALKLKKTAMNYVDNLGVALVGVIGRTEAEFSPKEEGEVGYNDNYEQKDIAACWFRTCCRLKGAVKKRIVEEARKLIPTLQQTEDLPDSLRLGLQRFETLSRQSQFSFSFLAILASLYHLEFNPRKNEWWELREAIAPALNILADEYSPK